MRSNGARVETGGRGSQDLGVGRFLGSESGGWLNYPTGTRYIEEGLGERNGDDVGDLEWWMVGVL